MVFHENFFTINCICIEVCCIIIFMVKITITENEAEQRLDRFLRKYLKKASLSFIYRLIRKDIKLNGKKAKEDTVLHSGDQLIVYISEEELMKLSDERRKNSAKKQFKVIYEDNDVLIVDKPRGLLTHGDSFEKKNTLANQVCGYLQEKGEYNPSREKTFTPSPVNRLDRNTTGLVIFGKNAAALRNMTKALRERNGIEKYYMTIVCGRLEKEMFLDERLEKDRSRNISGITSGNAGKEAFTYVRPLVTGRDFSLAEVRIFTGRTHQIRAHLAHAGFPLAGDAKYGSAGINMHLKKRGITTQLLHAFKLRFSESMDELGALKGKTVTSPLPAEFSRIRDMLISEKR